MKEAVIKTINYFSFFSYAPSFEEIHTFLSLETTKKKLGGELKRLVKKGFLIKKKVSLPQISNFDFLILNLPIYTLPPHRIFLDKRAVRGKWSWEKVEKIRPFLEALKNFPQIKLIGLSGAVSMSNAKKRDDVDLFVITADKRLFAGRFWALAAAEIFGLRRGRQERRPADKVCLNLFFDETEMKVPSAKRNLYVAHELLQMKPLVVKGDIYDRFLAANDWVRDFFPNALTDKILKKYPKKLDQTISQHYLLPKKYLGDAAEHLLKKMQLFLINRHKTTELVSDRQLWFFPNDFEKKLKRKGII